MADQEDYSDLAVAAPAKEDYSDLAQPAETSVTPAQEPTNTAYIPEKDTTVEHPASMSHDQVNDAVQTGVFDRPRNLSFNPNAADLTEAARNILTGNIAGLAEQFGEHTEKTDPKFAEEQAKTSIRVAESIPKGVSGLLDMMGQNLVQQAKLNDPEYQKNLAYTVGKGMSDIGKTAFEFYKDRGENGFEAPDPEIFRGSYMSNPSVTRLVSGIIENVPIVAATAALSAGTAGVGALALFGSMATGEGFESAKANGEDTQQATLVGATSGIGNMVLMSLPLEKYIGAISNGVLPEVAVRTAGFTGLGALMTPFNNITAKMGGEKSRKLFDGMAESLITMAASGFILGAMTPGRGAEIDQMIADAHRNGVSAKDIDAAREVIAKQIQENPDAVKEAMLEHSTTPRELGKGITQNEDGSITFAGPDGKEPGKAKTYSPEEVEGIRGEIVKVISESLKKGEGVPEQFADNHDLVDQAMAENKRSDKNSKRLEPLIERLSEQFMNGEKPEIDKTVTQDTINEAKQRAIDKINELEDENGKIRNRHQQVRFDLTKQLKEYAKNVETSTEATNQIIQDRGAKEREIKNEYEQKQAEYKKTYGEPTADEIASVDANAKSQAQAEFVREVSQGRERKTSDGPESAEEIKPSETAKEKKIFKLKTGEPANGVSPGPIEGGEEKGKSRGFEKFKAGLEENIRKAIEQDAKFDNSFERVDAADQAAKGLKFVEEQPERARRVALGLEAPPAGLSDRAVSFAYTEKAKADGNTVEQARAQLSFSQRNTRRAQELSLTGHIVGDNSSEQFINKVIEARKRIAGKKLFSPLDIFGKNDPEKVSNKITEKVAKEAKEISKRIKDKQMDMDAAQKFLESIKC